MKKIKHMDRVIISKIGKFIFGSIVRFGIIAICTIKLYQIYG